jgi:hypothetical protein
MRTGKPTRSSTALLLPQARRLSFLHSFILPFCPRHSRVDFLMPSCYFSEELPDLGTLALRGGKKLFTKLASRSSRSRSGSNASSTSTSTSQIDAGSTLLPKPQPNIIPPANPNERPLIARFDSTGSSASASSYASSSLNDPRPSIPSPPQQEDVREEDEDSVDLGPLPLSASTPLPQTASSVPHRPSAHQPRASSYINRPHSPPPSAFNYSSDVEEETSSSAYDSSDELDLDLSPDLPTAAERSKSSSEEDRAEVWTGSGKGWKARMVAEGMGGGGGREGNGGGLLGEGEATPRRRSPTPQAHSQLPSSKPIYLLPTRIHLRVFQRLLDPDEADSDFLFIPCAFHYLLTVSSILN